MANILKIDAEIIKSTFICSSGLFDIIDSKEGYIFCHSTPLICYRKHEHSCERTISIFQTVESRSCENKIIQFPK
jgi:hypothetical protein